MSCVSAGNPLCEDWLVIRTDPIVDIDIFLARRLVCSIAFAAAALGLTDGLFLRCFNATKGPVDTEISMSIHNGYSYSRDEHLNIKLFALLTVKARTLEVVLVLLHETSPCNTANVLRDVLFQRIWKRSLRKDV